MEHRGKEGWNAGRRSSSDRLRVAKVAEVVNESLINKRSRPRSESPELTKHVDVRGGRKATSDALC